MKKQLLVALMAIITLSATAQKTDHSFLVQEDAPNSRLILNAPPTERSAQFVYDQYRYFWGKALRDTPRGEMAYDDCNSSPEGMARAFSPSFGTPISKEGTPEIYKLIAFVDDDAGWWGTDPAKQHYKRLRPYLYFGEGTCNAADENGLSGNGSFPSGHTAGGWGVALVLAEINPDNQDTILRRGFSFGESRVICGYHWQSDVDAGYIMAAAVVARLHADDAFNRQMGKAKEEFARLKRQGKVKAVKMQAAQ